MKKNNLSLLILVTFLLVGGSIYAISNQHSNTMQGMMSTGQGSGHIMQSPQGNSASGNSAFYSQDIQGLPDAQPGSEVQLQNGEAYKLVASPVKKTIDGKEVRLLAYNGMVPGPRIRVRQGDEISVQFTNNTEVETSLHPHGVRVDNAFDGVVDVTQKAVKPGESFSYKLRFPDAGVFWYHPHTRDDYQQESGLYANFYVEPKEGELAGPVNSDEFLFLDDIRLDQKGLLPFPTAFTDFSLMGRFGNVMMVNWDTNYALTAQKGEVRRLFLTNSANTRTFALSIPGAKMKLIGSDGGLYEKETFVDSVTISPSERYIVDVFFPEAGTFEIVHKTPEKTYTLGKVTVSPNAVPTSYGASFQTLRSNEDVIKTMTPLKSRLQDAPDKELTLTMSMDNMQVMEHGSMTGTETPLAKIEWEDTMGMMNSMSTSKNMTWKIVDKQTGKENMDIDWNFSRGNMVKIRITNDANAPHPMQHPFHIHGQRFVVLATNDVSNNNLVWKDSVLIETGDTMDILVDMSNPGNWMAHCHILEHLHSGMMFGFTVQ